MKDSEYRITRQNPDGTYRAALEDAAPVNAPVNICVTVRGMTMTGYLVDVLGMYEDADEAGRTAAGRRSMERLTERAAGPGRKSYLYKYKNGSDFRTERFMGCIFAFGRIIDRLGIYEDEKIPA